MDISKEKIKGRDPKQLQAELEAQGIIIDLLNKSTGGGGLTSQIIKTHLEAFYKRLL